MRNPSARLALAAAALACTACSSCTGAAQHTAGTAVEIEGAYATAAVLAGLDGQKVELTCGGGAIMEWLAPPDSMAELLAYGLLGTEYVAVVVGLLGDELGTAIQPTASPYPTHMWSPDDVTLLWPITRFSVCVDRVLHGNGAVQPGGTLLLQHLGTRRLDRGPCNPMPSQGRRYLWILGRDHDMATGEYMAMGGFYGQIDLDSEPVRFTDESKTVVPFAREMSSEEFVEAVADAMEQR